ncbi:MAG: hypothetical protein OIF55_19230 [Amphritea sp.]|nr:hypothetical protein [Amphritea sp.]
MGRAKSIHDNGQLHGLQMACYHAVHDYQQGLSNFLDAAGISRDKVDVWRKKLSPSVDTNYLNPYEIEQIIEITRDERLLNAVGHLAGVVWMDAEQSMVPGDLDMLQVFGQFGTAAAAVTGHVAQALADGEVDELEFSQLEALQQKVDRMQGEIANVVEHYRRK